jgi:hypothetical protein
MVPPVVFVPVWLSVEDVKDQLRIDGDDVADDALIVRCSASTEQFAQRCRGDLWEYGEGDGEVDVYVPDAEVYHAAVMLSARLVRRRNSPGGVETFADSIAYVARYDPDIQRALHTGDYTMPGVG